MGNFYKRKRQPRGGRTVPLSPEAVAALEGQLQRFREKFGREPGPGDPVFFDPDKDVPTPMGEEKIMKKTIEVMRKAGIREELVYAYEKSGIILNEKNLELAHPEDVRAFERAVEEYRRKKGNVTRRFS